jgi:hypothetical protein
MLDWNPTRCRYLNDISRAERAESLLREGLIEWAATASRAFGSWNAAIEAAGYTPRARFGGQQNAARRRARSSQPR